MRRIDSLGRIVTGKTPSTKKNEYFDGPYPFITIPDLKNDMFIDKTVRSLSKLGAEKVQTSVIPENSVCVSCIATIGNVGLTTKPSVTNQQINSIICDNEVDPLFIYYAILNHTRYMRFVSGGGAVVPNISKTWFGKMEIPVPDYHVQKVISEKLFAFDKMIKNNHSICRVLTEYIESLFNSWFVYFDPVIIKSGSKYPISVNHEISKIISDNNVNPNFGQVPEGWAEVPLGKILLERKEKDAGRKIREFSCTDKGIKPRDSKFSKNLSSSPKNNKIAYKDDLIFGMSRKILNFGRMKYESGGFSSAYSVYTPNQEIIPSWYIEMFMKSYHDYYYNLILGSGREGQSIDKKYLPKMLILVPPKNIIDIFSKLVEPANQMIRTKKKETERIILLRDAILPKLVSVNFEA